MTVDVTFRFFSANNSCGVSVIPSDHGVINVTTNSVLTYYDLDDAAYKFIFWPINPEGGKIKIEINVNNKLYKNLEITKAGTQPISITVNSKK